MTLNTKGSEGQGLSLLLLLLGTSAHVPGNPHDEGLSPGQIRPPAALLRWPPQFLGNLLVCSLLALVLAR